MPLVSTLKAQVDLPVWEWTRFAPFLSSGLSSSASADNSNLDPRHGRYIYYLLSGAAFFRYDTVSDGYQQLASPPIALATFSAMKFAGSIGYVGRVISSANNSIRSSFSTGKALRGFDIQIIGGTGAGQQRTITDVSDPIVADSGTLTAAAAGTLTDANKAWTINQWVGFQVRTISGAGSQQVRKVLYNSPTVITFSDVNKYAEDVWCNTPIVANAPLALPVAGSIYQIESADIIVDSNWQINPDSTSQFKVGSGGIWMVTGVAAAPFYNLCYYDVASDQWYIRNSPSSQIPVAATDFSVERTGEAPTIWERGLATGIHTTTTLQDTNKYWITNQWAGYWMRIYSGTGEGQLRQIASNTTNTLTLVTVGTAPTNTSRYLITGYDAGTATSAATASGVSTLTDSTKSWATDRWNNLSVEIVSGAGAGQERAITATAATQLTVHPNWANLPDSSSRYVIHGNSDNIYMAVGGLANILVHSIQDDLLVSGRRLEGGRAAGVTIQYGNQTPIAVASATYVNPTLTVTTVNPHNFRTGMMVRMRGDTGAGAGLNNNLLAATVTGANTFTLNVGAGSASATVPVQSTTTLIDSSKTWTLNQWAGHIVTYNSAQGPSGVVQSMLIASNTSNTLTFAVAGVAPVQGVSRYTITAPATHPFRSAIGSLDSGTATGTQSTSTLQDTSKNWGVGQWVNRRLKFLSGAGQYQELTITANTLNTLTFGAAVAPVAGSTAYAILAAPIKGSGVNMNWASGISDSKRNGSLFTLPRGGGALGYDVLNIQTDAWDLTSPAPIFETLAGGSMYAYDGGDYVYFTKEVTLRLYRFNIVTKEVESAGQYPYLAGVAIIGNRMEIFKTIDGLKYLWLNRHSNLECYRCLLFF